MRVNTNKCRVQARSLFESCALGPDPDLGDEMHRRDLLDEALRDLVETWPREVEARRVREARKTRQLGEGRRA